jgi:hypothetical protein
VRSLVRMLIVRSQIVKTRLICSSQSATPPATATPAFALPMTKRSPVDYSPLSWDQYFETMDDVDVGDGISFLLYELPFATCLSGCSHEP